jgi:uncharacterized OsmC-like protein
MPDDKIIYGVSTTSTDVLGRCINSARHNHFVVDSPSGPNEALTTGEAFLSGISSCAVTLTQYIARDREVGVNKLTVDIEGTRDKNNPADFEIIKVHFTFAGPSEDQAADLVAGWKSRCPLYRAVSKGVPTEVTFETAAALVGSTA